MLHIIILAAGQGSRMLSATPKVLHNIAGKSLLQRVIDTAKTLEPKTITVVVGFEAEKVRQSIKDPSIRWVVQPQQHGTGHAVSCALEQADAHQSVADYLVLYGDVPLITDTTLTRLAQYKADKHLAVLSAYTSNPYGYGRVVRNAANQVLKIVEEKDASSEQQAITEINTGVMLISGTRLPTWLKSLKNTNAQGEFYLTDIVAFAAKEHSVVAYQTQCWEEVLGVNNRAQLAFLERYWQQQQAHQLMHAGVTLADPQRIDIRGTLSCGKDVFIDVGCIFEGKVVIGDNCQIGPYSYLSNTTIAASTQVHAYSRLESADIGSNCKIGPYARLRPGAVIAKAGRVGNFVEIKNTTIGEHSKVNHLSYVGDARVGANVNIGAGVITCNYDGVNKHQTVIEDNAFIGSNTQLVAPVRVGMGATVGAGSTLTKNAPNDALTLARSKQQTIHSWRRPEKSSDT